MVLCVAAKRPHKNQEVLVRAAAELAADVVLVLAGHAEPYERRAARAGARARRRERMRIRRLRSATPSSRALWRLAGCAAFPTLGEGFGHAR